MERLTFRYAKYFYIALIYVILTQLAQVVIIGIGAGLTVQGFLLIGLSVINLALLIATLKNTVKQQFVECKSNIQILRYSLGLLLMCHTFCTGHVLGGLIIRDHVLNIVVIELVLSYIMNSIEHLEKLANEFAKEHISK